MLLCVTGVLVFQFLNFYNFSSSANTETINFRYKKPKHVSIGEFLQEVTTTDGAAYLRPGFKRMEIEDFVDAYKSSNMYRDICRVLDSPELVQELWVQVKLFPNKSSIFSLI